MSFRRLISSFRWFLFTTLNLFLWNAYAEEQISATPSLSDAVGAELKKGGGGMRWRVTQGEELNEILSLYTSVSAHPAFTISSIPEVEMLFYYADGSTERVWISGDVWISEGFPKNRMLMAKGWRGRLFDPDRHDPGLRRAEFAMELKQRKVQRDEAYNRMKVKLSSIHLEEILYENAKVQTVISDLVQISREQDSTGLGINIILELPTQLRGKKEEPLHRITIKRSRVTLYEVLKEIADQLSWDLRAEKGLVVLGSPPVVTGTFTYLEGITNLDSSKFEAEMKSTLRQHGITFPEGTGVEYESMVNTIFVTHTEDTLLKIEKLWEQLNTKK